MGKCILHNYFHEYKYEINGWLKDMIKILDALENEVAFRAFREIVIAKFSLFVNQLPFSFLGCKLSEKGFHHRYWNCFRTYSSPYHIIILFWILANTPTVAKRRFYIKQLPTVLTVVIFLINILNYCGLTFSNTWMSLYV